MSNWGTITQDDLLEAFNSQIVLTAQSKGLAGSGSDPVPQAIANAIAQVRASIATGNSLDADPTKVPNSLRDLAMRIAYRKLLPLIPMPLDTEQREEKRQDDEDMIRYETRQVKFQTADNPAGSAEMQDDVLPVVTPRYRHFSAWQENGA